MTADDDPRGKLADWMADPDNPFFARTLANRYWKHFLGRGLVEPEDDMRVTNPPTNPELLDALAKHFTDSKYDLKKLVRTICTVEHLSAQRAAERAQRRAIGRTTRASCRGGCTRRCCSTPSTP